MGVINNNKYMIDRPMWEQLPFAPATGVAGTCTVDDNERYIYVLFQISTTASQFWRYDCWFDNWQQLATPATQTGTVNTMVFNRSFGTQRDGKVYGSVWLLNGNGTTAYFYKYDIATNAWLAMSVANVPATVATDVYLVYSGACKNNYGTTYHNSTTSNVTLSASAAIAGATTLTVVALGAAMSAGSILRFGTFDITVTTAAAKGATTLAVSGVTSDIATGTVLYMYDGNQVVLNGAVAASATSITVYPLEQLITANEKIKVERFAVLTAAAAAAATSLTVSALRVGIPASTIAPFYDAMYLVGNNAAVVYRYSIGSNAWALTSANSGNPAITAVTGTVGAGCALKWLPAISTDKLYCIRGGATANIYTYSLSGNTWATETFYPSTETFTTGSSVTATAVNGAQRSLILLKDATMRMYKYDPLTKEMRPHSNQWLYPTGGPVVGDKLSTVTSPDGIDYVYMLVNSSTAFVRCALIDS